MNKTVKAIVKMAGKMGIDVDKKDPIRNTEVINNSLCFFLNVKPQKIKMIFKVADHE